MRLATFVALSFLLAGCAGHRAGTFDFRNPRCTPYQHTDPSQVEVRYLGSGGVAIFWRGDGILLGPAFSNPSMLGAVIGRGTSDVERVRAAFARFEHTNVRAVFAAHSHYDHIGDLATVGALLPAVPMYVNASGVNMLCGEKDLRSRVHTLHANQTVRVGNTFMVRPIASGHANQICPWNVRLCRYAAGEVSAPRTVPIANQWRLGMRGGETFAFAIELLGDDGTTRYRIFYNDAASDSPLAQTVGPFDLAILCIAQWNWVRDYPRDLVAVLQPRHVLVSHWDNFFQRNDEHWSFVPLLSDAKVEEFRRIAGENAKDDAGPRNPVCGDRQPRTTMAVPGSSMLFAPH